MNREERRMLEKINRKEIKKVLIESVKNIYDEINDTEKLIAKANKNVTKIEVSQNISKVCEESVKTLEMFKNMFFAIRKIFLYNEEFDNGSIKKGVVNALKIPEYKAYLDDYVINVRRNKKKDNVAMVEYLICHDLSANKIEVRRTLDVLEQALPVIIANLKANNIADENIEYLVMHIATLERRLYQLYCLYRHYLEDTGNIEQYKLVCLVFDKIDDAFMNLMDIASN